MRDFTSSFSVERIQNSSTIVVTLRNVEYGSLHEAELATLQNDLADVNGRLESARHVIVDLSELTMFGSAFLRLIHEQLAPLKMLGTRVILCGDKTGLLALTAMHHWFTVTTTLDSALGMVGPIELESGFENWPSAGAVLVRCA